MNRNITAIYDESVPSLTTIVGRKIKKGIGRQTLSFSGNFAILQ